MQSNNLGRVVFCNESQEEPDLLLTVILNVFVTLYIVLCSHFPKMLLSDVKLVKQRHSGVKWVVNVSQSVW